MVENHALLQDVDADALPPMFAEVAPHGYWSTQSALLQGRGERFGLRSTFGVTAGGRLK